MAQGDGQEILVVDGDDKVQRGLAQLLAERGLQPTVVSDAVRARELVREKYFAAALIDLDTPQPSAGLELVRWLKQNAPATSSLVMASRKVFEAAVEAFRAGAVDVIIKAPDQVDYLRKRVVEVARGVQKSVSDDKLFQEALGVHEDFLKRLMEQSRRTAELEEQLGGGSHPSEADEGDCSVLVVEEEGWLGRELAERLDTRGGFRLVSAASGGEGLDRASADRFAIALVHDSLPDLPGSMVVTALKGQAPGTITILYTRPSGKPGRADVIDGSKAISLVPEFRDASQMVERLDELREASRRTSRERRYLAAFRQDHYELLKRYADLKLRLQRASQK